MLNKTVMFASLAMLISGGAVLAAGAMSAPNPTIGQPIQKTELPLVELSADQIFDGGDQSLVARTVGHAEGTRTAEGKFTKAYSGHYDPGNGAWNMGTFSYQRKGKVSPKEADRRHLKTLRQQYVEITQQAHNQGVILDLEATLNAIDLANQAPLAALAPGGFIDRYKVCKGDLLCTRSNAFRVPPRDWLNAPGLGNTQEGVEADQQRRIEAIKRACGDLCSR